MGKSERGRRPRRLRQMVDKRFVFDMGKTAGPWILLAAFILACGFYAGGRLHFSSLEAASQGDPVASEQARESSRIFIGASVAAVLGLALLYMTAVSKSFWQALKEVYNSRMDRYVNKRLLAIIREMEKKAEKETDTRLPKGYEFLIAFVTKPADREVVLGCSAERFSKDVVRHGRHRALCLQLRDILAALPSTAWTSMMKIFKWLAIGTAIERFFLK